MDSMQNIIQALAPVFAAGFAVQQLLEILTSFFDLDSNNTIRAENLSLFLDNLDPGIYRTDFEREGNSNYAFTLVLQKPDTALRDKLMDTLRRFGVEFRRGTSGGGNQLRQPYLKKLVGETAAAMYPHVDHVHFFGFYIGNYPGLEREKIRRLCSILNEIPHGS